MIRLIAKHNAISVFKEKINNALKAIISKNKYNFSFLTEKNR